VPLAAVELPGAGGLSHWQPNWLQWHTVSSFPSVPFCCVWGCSPRLASAAEDVLLAKGELLKGEVSGGTGGWQIKRSNAGASEVLWVRFSPEPPAAQPGCGLFIRDGSLLTGALLRWGVTTEVSSNALGPPDA